MIFFTLVIFKNKHTFEEEVLSRECFSYLRNSRKKGIDSPTKVNDYRVAQVASNFAEFKTVKKEQIST